MKIILTKLAKKELKNLNKVVDTLAENDLDIDLYYDFSSYDRLLFDLQMFTDGAYVKNKFNDVETFIVDLSESEGSSEKSVKERIEKGILFDLIKIN